MAIIQPPVIIEPYCAQGTEGVDYILPPTSGSSSIQSQANGWTSIFQQPLPPDGSGLPITRQQFNGVHNLYSSHDFWLQAGGTYTFEQDISDEYGGYPAGVVLYCASNKSRQLSLVNSNTANFVSDTTKINDGINWKQLDLPYGIYDQLYTVSATTTANINNAGRIFKSSVNSVALAFNAQSTTYPRGWSCYVGGSTTSMVTTFTKSTGATYVWTLKANDVNIYQISCDSSTWFINGINIDTFALTGNTVHGQYFQSVAGSYNFVVPSGVNTLWITAAAGGGGGGAGNDGGAGGGAGGECVNHTAYTVTPGTTLAITLGAGGAGGTLTSAGGAGGNLTITGGVTLTLNGGPGGNPGSAAVSLGGSSGNGIDGGAGVYLATDTICISGAGGGTVLGATTPGTALFPPGSSAGQVGLFGAGGAGGCDNGDGGAGGAAAILIEY